MRKSMVLMVAVAVLGWGSAAAGDLYDAGEALAKQDLERAFSILHELAKLGLPAAQESVAAAYVNGEGVPRNNVLGYAWAALARANGAGQTSQSIITQLEPHLSAASRETVKQLHDQYGPKALRQTLLPVLQPVDEARLRACTIEAPANPDFYYPEQARKDRVQGIATVHVTVGPDGGARNPWVWYSFPVGVFDQTARAVALQTRYKSAAAQGEPPCKMLYRVRYTLKSPANNVDDDALKLGEAAAKGDPRSQLAYGVLLSTYPHLNHDKEFPLIWFLKAAQAGMHSAQYLVARHLEYGSGVVPDEAKARRWFELSATGNSSAMVALAMYDLRKPEDTEARARAVQLLSRASDTGNWLAQYYLAALLASDARAPWHDPRRALQFIDSFNGGFDYDPASFEIKAAAHAHLGEFRKATNAQRRAIREARYIQWDVTAMRERLARYEAGEAWNGDLIEF